MKILLGLLVAFALATPLIATWREARFRAAFPPIGDFIAVDGLQVHYVMAGSGPDLVLIHGSSGNLRDFTFSLVSKLKDHYRVIVFDRPGLGYSDALPDGLIFNQAEHLHKAAVALGVKDAIVLGHSYGGPVAISWALNHPEDTAALVTLAAPTRPWDTPLGTYYTATSSRLGQYALVPILTAYVPTSLARGALAALFANGQAPSGLTEYYGAELALQRDVMRANASQRATLLAEVTELSRHYAEIKVPWEALHGTADDVVSADFHMPTLLVAAPTAKATLLPGAGHMIEFEAEDAVITAIGRAAARAGLRAHP